MKESKIKKQIEASIAVKRLLLGDSALISLIDTWAELCTLSLRAGGKVVFCGNGGSFADAQHLSAEFTSRFLFDRPGLASIALGTNSSAMTAIGNDYGYVNVFSREIEAVVTDNDILIALTTSGNSPNILKALEAAEKIGVPTLVLTGETGGSLPKSVPMIKVPSTDTARVQESHILVGHIICEIVESNMFETLATAENIKELEKKRSSAIKD